jgi:hypothetical protein
MFAALRFVHCYVEEQELSGREIKLAKQTSPFHDEHAITLFCSCRFSLSLSRSPMDTSLERIRGRNKERQRERVLVVHFISFDGCTQVILSTISDEHCFVLIIVSHALISFEHESDEQLLTHSFVLPVTV